MTLGDKQRLFCSLIAEFIVWCYANDYELTFGEAQRSQAQATANAAAGIGISNSLHLKRLAIDLNLFLDITVGGDEDVYATDSAAYLPLGMKWESMNSLCRWGGRFSRPDGNHFSLEHEGVR